jgi:hypothetical protein
VELNSPYDWKNWWTQAREEGRVASLIHGTTSHSEQIRIWVSAEIANIAGLDLQYDPHGPPEEWKNAASVLKEWFRSTSN